MLKTLGVSACAFMAPASPLGVALVLGLRLLCDVGKTNLAGGRLRPDVEEVGLVLLALLAGGRPRPDVEEAGLVLLALWYLLVVR